jgi:uncharacterized protein (TIGR02594 family)
MTSEAPLWLAIAIDELGQTEIEGPHHNPRILAYHQATSLKAEDDETPWCASFVNWCLSGARIVGTNKANARSFLDWGQAIAIGKMRHGDIVIFERNKPWQGHVGFVYASKPDSIQVLGGNQGDAVSLAWYPMRRLLGIRRPE